MEQFPVLWTASLMFQLPISPGVHCSMGTLVPGYPRTRGTSRKSGKDSRDSEPLASVVGSSLYEPRCGLAWSGYEYQGRNRIPWPSPVGAAVAGPP
eukprot:2029005-Rhodomonas_salina.1